jgi:hypothetical protein
MKLYVKLAIFLIGSSIGGSITWLIYKRKFRKSSISYNLSTPFNISTSNRKYIGYDESECYFFIILNFKCALKKIIRK